MYKEALTYYEKAASICLWLESKPDEFITKLK